MVLSKAIIAPKHALTMPRLELCAAVLAVEMGNFAQGNLELVMDTTSYYTDCKVVLGYIHNRTRRFYTYVAKRVQQILLRSAAEQWRYVPTNLNPTDLGTRAIPADELATSSWLLGPCFLRSDPSFTDTEVNIDYPLGEEDKEV